MKNNTARQRPQPPRHETRSTLSCKNSVTVLLAICFLFIHSAHTFSLPIMGPETEPRIEILVKHNADRFPLPDDWNVHGWHYTDFDIFIHLEGSSDKKAVFRLTCTSLPSESRFIGESRNFRMELVSFSGVPEKEAVRVAHALLERIRHNDQSRFFDQPDMKNREGIFTFLFRKYIFLPLILAGLAISAVLFVTGFPLISKYLLPNRGTTIALLTFLVISGVVIRIAIGPEAPVHNNGHGVRELRAILYPESQEQKEILYGMVYITIMRRLVSVAGGTDLAVFRINMVFGALAILSMYMAGRALLLSEASALTAAIAVCLSPGLVWLSGSESPGSMYLFFALAGTAFAIVSARLRNKQLLWLSCIFICIASSMRFTTMTAAPATLILFTYSYFHPSKSINRNDRTFHKHALMCLGIMAIWLCFHYFSMDPQNIGKGFDRFSPGMYIHNMGIFNILFDPTLSPACLPYLAMLGLVLTLWKRPLLAISAVIVFVLIIPVSFTTMADRTDFVRYQPQTHWLYFLFAGVLAGFIEKSPLPRRISFTAALYVPLTIAIFSITGLKYLAAGYEEIAEYNFIKKTVSEFKPGVQVALPVRPADGGRMNSEFPDYLGKYRLERVELGGEGLDGIIYVGLDCYRYDDIIKMGQESADNGMRRECASICNGSPIPLREKLLEAHIPAGVFHRRYFTLGTQSPTVGFYKCRGNNGENSLRFNPASPS